MMLRACVSGSKMTSPYREILEKFRGKKALWRINLGVIGGIYEMILEKISPSGWYVKLVQPYSWHEGKWYKVPQEAVPLEILED